MEQLTPFGPTYKDSLLNRAVQQAIRLNRKKDLYDILGPDWREARTNVRTAARFLDEDKSGVFRNLRNAAGHVTIGAVWDRHRKRATWPTVSDYDNLAAWSFLNKWPLNAERSSAVRFMRTANAARIAGLDLSTAEVTTRAITQWGLHIATAYRWAAAKGDYYEWWKGRTRKVRVRRRGERGGNTLRVWRVSDLLDWFLLSTLPVPALSADRGQHNQDPARNCFRSILLNLRRFRKAPNDWIGACNLQRAWNWYWLLMDVAVGRREGEANLSAHRLDHYVSQSLQALASADPDWTRPALDTSEIHPNAFYQVWIPPGDGARTDVVHVPASARLIQILGDKRWDRGMALSDASRTGIDTGRVAAVPGTNIIAYPNAYTR